MRDVPTLAEMDKAGPAHFRDAWSMICREIDYVPVFELAAQLMDILSTGPTETKDAALRPLLAAASETRKVEGHDLSGRLFHTLLS